MTKKIFRSVFLVALAVLLTSMLLITAVVYEHFTDKATSKLADTAVYISRGYEALGESYLESLKGISDRITLIDKDGSVIFDTQGNASEFENHLGRKEIADAIKYGSGTADRYSETISKRTFYYALRLSSGQILRVSNTDYSSVMILVGMLRPFLLIAATILIVSAILASATAKSVVGPINRIDLENPMECKAYPELSPLITKIEYQNHTIRRQMKDLQRKQQEFSAITANMSEGLVISDGSGKIISRNSAAEKLLGKEKLASTDFLKLCADTSGGKHSITEASVGDGVIQIIANPVKEDEKPIGAVLLIIDVTEKSHQEQMRREFTANVSHELKTPLTSISGFAEIIRDGIAKDEDVARFADKIYMEAKRLVDLVNDIINLSRLDEASPEIQKEPVDLRDVCAAVIESLSDVAKKLDVTLSLDAEEAVIDGIKPVIEEMVYNLTDNAIKYNKPHGRVDVTVKKTDSDVVLSVADTGIGIPAQDIPRVTERFYRVDKSHSRQIGGTGLGLSIVKHGAALHRAGLRIESERDKGTTVSLTFPRK